MNRSLERIQAWRSRRALRREQRSLEWWERVRTEGKNRFVWRTSLTYGLSLAGIIDVIQRGFYSEVDPLLLKIVFGVVFGIVMGWDTWTAMEAKRDDALRKTLAIALPDSQTLPQSGKGVS